MRRFAIMLVVMGAFAGATAVSAQSSAQRSLAAGKEAYDRGDFGAAARLYEEACGGGDAIGCYRLGYVYERGEGVAEDDTHAAELYWKSCNAGYNWSCDFLADFYKLGIGVPCDPDLALAFYNKALSLTTDPDDRAQIRGNIDMLKSEAATAE